MTHLVFLHYSSLEWIYHDLLATPTTWSIFCHSNYLAMEQLLNKIIGQIATLIEMGAAVFITMGALETFYQLFILTRFNIIQHPSGKREVWLQFATWLVLALEFELAADVLRTTIAPSWNDVGQLAAIALIRTFLNFFLEKDIASVSSNTTSK